MTEEQPWAVRLSPQAAKTLAGSFGQPFDYIPSMTEQPVRGSGVVLLDEGRPYHRGPDLRVLTPRHAGRVNPPQPKI